MKVFIWVKVQDHLLILTEVVLGHDDFVFAPEVLDLSELAFDDIFLWGHEDNLFQFWLYFYDIGLPN